IYRNVRLVKTAQTYVAHWGTFVTTPKITAKSADVTIKTEINALAENANVKFITEVYSKKGEKVRSVTTTQIAAQKLIFNQQLKIKNPQLWSIETPSLYTAISK
ncbi:hypothetical protein JZU68_05155, partial [bacterium]|nr:hypothetical protein [bacterium]